MTSPSDLPDSRITTAFDQIQPRCRILRDQLRRIVLGQEAIIDQLLAAVICQGHVLIVGVPGLAKTLLVRSLAQATDLQFKRIQFTPDMMPSDILGTELIQDDPATNRRSLHFVPGPIFAQLILADEVNRAPPKTQSALLEAMAEHQVSITGKTMKLQEPFIVVATQNPIEQEGTYPLPEAQLDRFMYCLWMDYPASEDELKIAVTTPGAALQATGPVLDRETLHSIAQLVGQVPVSPHVARYAVDLVRATRPSEPSASPIIRQYVQWGAGPRATQYLVQSAKALAAIQGQPTPSCGHVRLSALPVLRHRIVLNYTAAAEGIAPPLVINKILEQTPEPTYA